MEQTPVQVAICQLPFASYHLPVTICQLPDNASHVPHHLRLANSGPRRSKYDAYWHTFAQGRLNGLRFQE
uniref:HDC17515 n=1 Tax=Drosophila melanogaster TaxID=7227 RepID=Q6IIN3_DROME|nr:TPA_inf: HDC17515 [Drosophila melanogaster]